MHFGRYASRKSEARYPSLWEGLVGAWCPSIQSPSGNTLYDLSGRNRNGTLTNMDPAGDWVRSGLDFDGVDDYVSLGSPEHLRLNGSVSVSAWVFPRSTSQHAVIAHATAGVAYFALVFSFLGDQRVSFWNSASGPVVTAPSTTQLNEWHHFCARRTPAGTDLFVNGFLVSTSTQSTGNGTASAEMSLGRFGSFNGYFSSAIIRNAMIWNRGLTSSEVSILSRRLNCVFEPRRSISFGSAFRFRRGYSQIFTSGVIG